MVIWIHLQLESLHFPSFLSALVHIKQRIENDESRLNPKKTQIDEWKIVSFLKRVSIGSTNEEWVSVFTCCKNSTHNSISPIDQTKSEWTYTRAASEDQSTASSSGRLHKDVEARNVQNESHFLPFSDGAIDDSSRSSRLLGGSGAQESRASQVNTHQPWGLCSRLWKKQNLRSTSEAGWELSEPRGCRAHSDTITHHLSPM